MLKNLAMLKNTIILNCAVKTLLALIRSVESIVIFLRKLDDQLKSLFLCYGNDAKILFFDCLCCLRNFTRIFTEGEVSE